MDIRNRRALKQEAAAALDAAPNQKKIIALYAGASLLVSLVVTLLDLLLSSMVEKTSGLSSIGTRTILQTVQNVLPIAQFAFLLIWEYGYMGTVLGMRRHRMADHRELLGGLRFAGPIARLTLLEYGIAFVLSFASMYLSIMIFLCTPFARPIMEAAMAIVQDNSLTPADMMADPGLTAAVNGTMLPLMGIFLVIYCLLVLPITYLFRMSAYCLLDNPQAGALAALRESRRMMRRNRLKLLMLDLSFWWYHLLALVLTVICYGDILLPLVGVTLPFGETGNSMLFYGLYLVAQFAFSYFFQNYIEVTYAGAYEALKPKPQEGGIVLGNIFQM